MTDDKELIARLRAYREHDEGSGGMASFEVDECIEAANRIEALTEQLAAASQDTKALEDELEMQEQEACMMENDYIKLEKERDAIEAKLARAEWLLTDAAVQLEEGKIKTRRNRAGLIWQFLDEIKAT